MRSWTSRSRRSSEGRIVRVLTAVVVGIAVEAGVPGHVAGAPPQSPAEALEFERADRLPEGSFYETPVPLPPAIPGALIRSREASEYDLPAGVRATRILYHSESATGRDVPASGVVLLPPGSAPDGGWPVIAWAHGTSGVARKCAPSLMKDLYYGEEGLFPMVRAGFAVVAPDYAGLGTAGPHQYLHRRAQAHDVINAVRAAREAAPGLSPRWVVDGHSQGGGAAWGVAEDEAELKDPGYLGAVAVAGTVNPRWVDLFERMKPPESFYAVYAARAVNARFPDFDVEEMLTPKALAHYDDLTSGGCWYYGAAVARSGGLDPVLEPGWEDDARVQRFIAENETFRRPVAGPVFLLAGGADQSVPPESIREAAEEACRRGVTVQFRLYPGLDHDPLMDRSTPDQLDWIEDRFAGEPPPTNCGSIDH